MSKNVYILEHLAKIITNIIISYISRNGMFKVDTGQVSDHMDNPLWQEPALFLVCSTELLISVSVEEEFSSEK